jgi:hypothetical protein
VPHDTPDDRTGPSSLVDELDAMAGWLGERGIDASRGRFGAYRNFLRELPLDESWSAGPTLDRFVFVRREVTELLWIYNGLRLFEPPGALGLLQDALGGSATAAEDAQNRHARNVQFELRIAVYFVKAGFQVDMSTPSDVVVSVDQVDVLVECKRLRSHNQVARRMKKAARQLRLGYGRSGLRRRYGLVALDVSQVIHPRQGLASANSRNDGRDGIRAQLLQFIEEFEIKAPFAADRHLLSIWTQCLTPCVHGSPPEITTRFSSIHTVMARPGSNAAVVFNSLRPAFDSVDSSDDQDEGAGGTTEEWIRLNQDQHAQEGRRVLPPLRKRVKEE